MKNAKKILFQELEAVLETHLENEAPARLSPDVIAKVLHKLAKQVLLQPGKATASKVSHEPLTAKDAHKAVASKLTSEVQAYLGDDDKPVPAPVKALTKTIKRLAKQVVKQQRKQPTPPTKSAQPAVPALQLHTPPPSAPTPLPAASPKTPTVARRPPAAAKRAAKVVSGKSVATTADANPDLSA